MLEKMEGPAGAINVDDGGSGGLPVLFIHSAIGNLSHWSRQLEHIRKFRRGIALDLRGRGLSAPPGDKNLRVESQAGDIASVVMRFGLQKLILVGHNMGGSVAIAYAGRAPARVAGLLLVDVPGDSRQVLTARIREILALLESRSYRRAIEDLTRDLLQGADGTVTGKIMRELRKTDRETNIRLIRELFRFDPVPALTRYQGPVLSIVTPRSDNEYSLHRMVPGIDHVVVPGTSHWIQMDKPDEFNRIMDAFLRLVDAEASKKAGKTAS